MTDDSLLPKSKVCSKCGEEKLLEEFYKDKKKKYGTKSECKACVAERGKQYYKDNKEKLNEVSKKYKEENKEQIKKRQADRLKNLIDNDLLPKSKVCAECGKEKLLEEFHKHADCKYGVESRCKACGAERDKQYRHNNKEAISEWHKQHYQENKEEISKYGKQYREANKERIKQYRQDNKEKLAELHKRYREANKERINENNRNRRKNDEQFRIRCCLSNALNQSLNAAKTTKKNSTLTYIGCSIEFMKEHLNSTKKPNWGDDLHIDHIIPSSLFDHTNEEEIKKCWNWRNLRYLPAEENISKHNKLDMDLVKSYGIEDLLPEGVDK